MSVIAICLGLDKYTPPKAKGRFVNKCVDEHDILKTTRVSRVYSILKFIEGYKTYQQIADESGYKAQTIRKYTAELKKNGLVNTRKVFNDECNYLIEVYLNEG